MGEIKKFPGRTILSQILKLIPGQLIHAANRKHKTNRNYKTLSFRVHLVSMLYGGFSYCNRLKEVLERLFACEGNLSHLGLDKTPERSTLSDANTNRNYQVFERFTTEYSGSTIALYRITDSTTIQLFSEIPRGVGRNRLDGARKKGGIKAHALMHSLSGVTEFIWITEALEHDRKFLYHLKLAPNNWIVFTKPTLPTNSLSKYILRYWFGLRSIGTIDQTSSHCRIYPF